MHTEFGRQNFQCYLPKIISAYSLGTAISAVFTAIGLAGQHF